MTTSKCGCGNYAEICPECAKNTNVSESTETPGYKPTYVKIKIHGHQHYSEVIGEIISFCQGVERYHDDNCSMQVPAIAVKTKKGITIVHLEKERYWTKVSFLTEDELKQAL